MIVKNVDQELIDNGIDFIKENEIIQKNRRFKQKQQMTVDDKEEVDLLGVDADQSLEENIFNNKQTTKNKVEDKIYQEGDNVINVDEIVIHSPLKSVNLSIPDPTFNNKLVVNNSCRYSLRPKHNKENKDKSKNVLSTQN